MMKLRFEEIRRFGKSEKQKNTNKGMEKHREMQKWIDASVEMKKWKGAEM